MPFASVARPRTTLRLGRRTVLTLRTRSAGFVRSTGVPSPPPGGGVGVAVGSGCGGWPGQAAPTKPGSCSA